MHSNSACHNRHASCSSASLHGNLATALPAAAVTAMGLCFANHSALQITVHLHSTDAQKQRLRHLASILQHCCSANRLKTALPDAAVLPLRFCIAYPCAFSQHYCTATAPETLGLHHAAVLLCKTTSQQPAAAVTPVGLCFAYLMHLQNADAQQQYLRHLACIMQQCCSERKAPNGLTCSCNYTNGILHCKSPCICTTLLQRNNA